VSTESVVCRNNDEQGSFGLSAQLIRDENRQLEQREREMDNITVQMRNALKLATEDPTDKPYSYVRYSDLRAIPVMAEQTVIAVKAPAGSSLEVPDPKETGVRRSLLTIDPPPALGILLTQPRFIIRLWGVKSAALDALLHRVHRLSCCRNSK
jgi:hypothetical protein